MVNNKALRLYCERIAQILLEGRAIETHELKCFIRDELDRALAELDQILTEQEWESEHELD